MKITLIVADTPGCKGRIYAGSHVTRIDVEDGTTVAQLQSALPDQFFTVRVNRRPARQEQALCDGDTCSFVGPVIAEP